VRRLSALTAVVLFAFGLAACEITEPQAGETWLNNSYITGYTYQDNNPPNSAEICCPSVHQEAGGTGTYNDPITVAVDYSTGTTMQYAAGTRFYIPNLRAYFVAEDRTGELEATNTADHGTDPHLDVWIDGRTETAAQSDACARAITNTGLRVILNPQQGYAVTVGPVAANNTCRQNAGNSVQTS
jgi:hypothetical protein